MSPSPTGTVSSNTWSLVKLRMLKLSSHFSGHGCRWPASSYSTRILRANIVTVSSFQCENSLEFLVSSFKSKEHPAHRHLSSRAYRGICLCVGYEKKQVPRAN